MTATNDATLIEQTLERLAEAADDITPQVYDAFFSMRPEAEQLFGEKFGMGRGHMLNEVFTCLLELANGKEYLDFLMQGYVSDHDSYGVKDISMYREFLSALRTTVSEVLGKNWPPDEKAAFDRQCDRMNDQLIEAEKNLIARKIISTRNR